MSRDIVSRFLEQSHDRPDAVAISGLAGDITYGALERRVRAFAASFARVDEPRVLIACPPSIDAYACIIASGLSGGFHTPVNLSSPPEKCAKIAKSLQPTAIVGDTEVVARIREAAPSASIIDPTAVSDAEQFEGNGRRHNLAYVFFTSGSTGEPKGVMVSRQALAHYVGWLEALKLRPGDRVSQQPSLAFDISMTDIFGALCYGATLCPVESEADRLTPARFIARMKITVWNSTPSAISLMMRARQLRSENIATVRLFNFCGEPLLKEHLDAIFAASPDVRVQNTYGPTEATVSMTALDLNRLNYEYFCLDTVALGAPIPDMDIVLSGGTTPDEGELVIVGPQVAEGYWNDPERTASAFRQVSQSDARRGYFTGDWVKRHGGELYFQERIDFQVKIRGHRIECGEVASAIRESGYPVTVVFKHNDLLAAVVEAPGERHSFDERALKDALSAKLEPYAVPEQIVMVDHIPRNENDKLDRNAAALLIEQI